MSRNREVSQLGNFVAIDESSKNNVGIATTVRISNGGGLFVGGVEVIAPDGTWKGPNSGLIGSQGAQGAQGAQGRQGAQGPQGAQGATGSGGSTGSQGPQGAQGFQGFQGFQGIQGSSGTLGSQGPQGATGSQGFQGVQGANGTLGSQGPQGAQGAQGALGAQGTSGAIVVPSGTTMVFFQTNAPTGWTKITTHNDKALRVVSGTGGGSGGSTAFTSVFASRTPSGSVTMNNAAFTLTTNEMPAHSHSTSITNVAVHTYNFVNGGRATSGGSDGGVGFTMSNAGGGASHTHANTASFSGSTMDFAVQYVDLIIASKD